MKKVILISFSIILIFLNIFCIIDMIMIRKNERVKYLAMGEFIEETNMGIFNEDKNIAVPTYLIFEKEIKVPILLYHEFHEETPEKKLMGVISTPEKFENNILYIMKQGYTFVSLDRVIDYKNGVKDLPEKSVVLTFDDGYLSNYTLIYPILTKYNIPATIFIIGDMVGSNNYFDWDIAKKMNDEGLVKIYTHGHTHVDMTKLDIDDFREKTINNLKLMEEKLGKQNHVIYSYPLGFYNEETNKVLKELGVEMYMTTNKGLNGKEELESGILKRDYIAYNFSERKIKSILKGK